MFLIEKTHNWYKRFERPISSISLLTGFVIDSLTLKRVDTLFENLWILGHIVIAGVIIFLLNKRKDIEASSQSKLHFWLVTILQFIFGGTLSAFLVFYFRSTDILNTWPFLLILAFAFIANESFKKHYIRQSFQISLLFISTYSFAIFIIPVLLHKIGSDVFIVSGLVSLLLIGIFTKILFRLTKDRLEQRSKRLTTIIIFSIFIGVNILYFTNLIPPIPLSLKEAGVYHSIKKNTGNDYDITYEDYGWREYFNLYQEYHRTIESPVYAYSAVFSPSKLNLTIVHEWQSYDESSKKWVTQSVVNLSVIGGREQGFRTYSKKSVLTPGKWRVNIKTSNGQTIGSLRFKIVNTDTEPYLSNKVEK